MCYLKVAKLGTNVAKTSVRLSDLISSKKATGTSGSGSGESLTGGKRGREAPAQQNAPGNVGLTADEKKGLETGLKVVKTYSGSIRKLLAAAESYEAHISGMLNNGPGA